MTKYKKYKMTVTMTYLREDIVSIKDMKEMMLQDFYDECRHGNITPKIKFEKVR